MSQTVPERQRIDAWLWRARFFKTRADASGFVQKRGVRVFRGAQALRAHKPSQEVQIGDVLTFVRKETPVVVEVLGVSPRRLSPEGARALYRPKDDET